MANRLTNLRKENNAMDEQLSAENNRIMTDMVCYLRSSRLSEYDIETIRKELIGMALEAQARSQAFSAVVGQDYKAMCDELMKSGRQKTPYEHALGLALASVFCLGILYLVEVVLSLPTMVRMGQFTFRITLSLLITALFSMAIGLGVYQYFTRKSFELSANKRTQLTFIVGLALIWTAIVLAGYLTRKIVLFEVNCLYPAGLLALAYTALRLLDDRHANSLFQQK